MTRVAFIGTGSMNGALAAGLLAAGADPATVRATVGSRASMEGLEARLGAPGLSLYALEDDPQANLKAVEGADLVVLGVKPYAIAEVAAGLAPALSPGAVVISVAAGISIRTLAGVLPEGQPVIRCMPNTPAQLGKGVLALALGPGLSQEQREAAFALMGSVGRVIEVREDQMGAVTAVSGSGPAYAFLLAEAMAAAGQQLGLEAELARELAAATVAGAGFLLDADPDPQKLRLAVTSPQGTTDRAIRSLMDGGFFELTATAMEACQERSWELEQQLNP